ncbi:hypothetical protein COW36_21245 [bacterium (Candidatus Blackallbacteria) CG17_big_fil_post_rev_8_21_14_2_50_48_46]|uniref:SPOR domain-containing protein n=1 Tax=bacterium (Candidatus Blackallbacteria) CG17_big_fil_post_rev_8_21_14_2_50_48_46 TaxID=2014261 RepID=A0A2M7FZK1_9BACT|nr:MAG: hypothetical protein COW64_14555 [bacterium (Candidatus Blackallbacteria) CG18_big_fil_WC_8_21_14_2_50_49_26]PIW14566.1 MAG: hypothetical protein COW36_21245 [bacterium (Candidatus Blackallbacteria) CG17_big_fil_post_rev_8_21_14_2_50_48_46]PIW47251.1 MAG: hypothetical protein COW20_13690 [bacterium (Candidatus Blackallbacteria) CG13_big_fil_rev_8_21_14_2_50_49_14]
MRLIWMGLGFLWGVCCLNPLAAQAQERDCGLLNAGQIHSLVKKAEAIQQTSQVKGRCHFEWPKASAEQIKAENEARLRASMQRGGAAYQPLATWASLDLEIRGEYASAEEAIAAYLALLAGGVESGYGSPDPLAGQLFKAEKPPAKAPAKPAKPNQKNAPVFKAAWNAHNQTLLFQRGRFIFVLKLDIEASPEKNHELALQLVPLVQL